MGRTQPIQSPAKRFGTELPECLRAVQQSLHWIHGASPESAVMDSSSRVKRSSRA